MDQISLTTPGLLFSAISLLLLAYTNRFLALAALIRKLHTEHQQNPDTLLLGQIRNLQRRVLLIKSMQMWGVASLFLCVLCMFLIFWNEHVLGQWVFGAGLVLLLVSLGLSIKEIQISVNALNLHLKNMENNS
ncbi:DUF2721 domain-containing protein [Ascidiimonas aurantiaca]|uniref:DUF2721 domain-containing protein n=1 Tax=Ascidiimonas aurantiaca TaxID=1685432 RepID=UPI0030EB30EA